MDPFTVASAAASLGLGGASLAIQIFQGIVIGFEYFEAAAVADKDCDAFRLRLRIEYARLYDWGELTGLLDEATHGEYDRKTRQSRTMVIAILNELDYLLRQLRSTELRYEGVSSADPNAPLPGPIDAPPAPGSSGRPRPPHTSSPAMLASAAPSGGSTEPDVQRLQALFGIQTAGAAARKHKRGLNHIMAWTSSVGTIAKQPKRILWAVRDKDKFASKLGKVSELVNYLHHTLSEDQMQVLVESARDTKLGLLALTDDVAEMKALLQAVKQALPSDAVTVQSLSGTTLIDAPASSQQKASELEGHHETHFKRFLEQAIEFKILVSSTTEALHSSAKLSGKDIQSGEEFDNNLRTSAALGDRRGLWIEWKDYKPVVFEVSPGRTEKGPNHVISTRVEHLAALLTLPDKPAEFSVPKCLGYFHDRKNHRFGFVFAQFPMPWPRRDRRCVR